MKKKILIIGNSPKEYALAKKLSNLHEVYVTPASDTLKEFATCLDIREDSIKELLEFVVENDIDMTIAVSQKAINADIATLFTNNKQAIFAPSANASKVISDKAFAKKIMYKLRIPTPKFGIFEKNNIAVDYIKNQKLPFVIKTNDNNSAVIITSANIGKNIIDMIFREKNKKVIIEDYVYGTPFSFYSITDGYKALPLGSSLTYKHKLEGNGGQLTSGMGACVPNYKLSNENEYYIMNKIIYPLLEYLDAEGNTYTGILGINGIITEDNKLQILGWNSFPQDSDSLCILKSIDDDLYNIFEACIIGSFSDEFENINLNNNYSVSIVLSNHNKENPQNIIKGLDNIDEDTLTSFYPTVRRNKYLELEAEEGAVMVLSSSASSMAKAVEKVYSEVKDIDYKGITYRKDICKFNI